MRIKLCISLSLILVTSAFAQEPVGGPYNTDAATVVLFHFDDDLTNAASTGGTASANGGITYVDGMPGFGKAVFLDNHTAPDSTQAVKTWLSFGPISELNLPGDLTVEGWFKYADTFLTNGSDPSYLVSQPAHNSVSRHNFAVVSNFAGPTVYGTYTSSGNTLPINAGGSGRQATASFEDSQGFALPEQLGAQWLHFTYQRSTALRVISIAIHDSSGALLYFNYRQTHPAWDTPYFRSLPLLLGRQSASSSRFGYFHGYLDEVRISNTTRYMDLPPVILYKHYLREPMYSRKIGNQLDTQSEYPFDLTIAVLGANNGVQSANIFYRLVVDQYDKVPADDPRWNQVAMAQGDGDTWTGAIPQQPLGTVMQYYHNATSTTGLTHTFGANPDSSYDRFGVMKENDIVLKLSFEEEDLNFIDSSGYNHQLNTIGFWALNDDEDVPEGEIAAQLLEGTSAFGEIVSPFLSLEEYTITVWLNSDIDTARHNIYVISNVPGANVRDSYYYTTIGSGAFSAGAWFVPNYTLLLRSPIDSLNAWDMGNDGFLEGIPTGVGNAWQYDNTRAPFESFNVWYHWMINLGPDSLVMQVNDADDIPITRVVVTKERFKGTEIIPFAPTISKFRIGPPGLGSDGTYAGQPFYVGKIDELVVYNYQTFPGNFSMTPIPTAVDEDITEIPAQYELSQNYPNPFNPGTTIAFVIPKAQDVKLEIYNMLGRRVKTLVEDKMQAGAHKVAWDGTNDLGKAVASGTYIYKLRTESFTETKRLVLVR